MTLLVCFLVCSFVCVVSIAGPIESSIPDFWRMVWEQNSNIIVMITGLIERGVVRDMFTLCEFCSVVFTIAFSSSSEEVFEVLAFIDRL